MIVQIITFSLAVIFTIDFITDCIEVMSGRSEEHKILNETKIDVVYQFIVTSLWIIFYLTITL